MINQLTTVKCKQINDSVVEYQSVITWVWSFQCINWYPHTTHNTHTIHIATPTHIHTINHAYSTLYTLTGIALYFLKKNHLDINFVSGTETSQYNSAWWCRRYCTTIVFISWPYMEFFLHCNNNDIIMCSCPVWNVCIEYDVCECLSYPAWSVFCQ